MATPTGHFRGENGQVLEMDLPLSDAFAGRLARGELVRVNADGSTWDEPSTALPVVDSAEREANMAEVHAALSEALTRVEELTAELELATKQRDALAVEVAEVKAALESKVDVPPAKATTAKSK